MFDRVGLFEERFVAYFEDADLNLRARLARFHAALVPQAVAFHIGSASLDGKMWWRSRQCYRNHAWLVLRNCPLALLVRHGGAIFLERLHQARRVLSSARAEFGLARAMVVWLGAWVSVWAALPSYFVARRRITAKRCITSRELDNLLTKS